MLGVDRRPEGAGCGVPRSRPGSAPAGPRPPRTRRPRGLVRPARPGPHPPGLGRTHGTVESPPRRPVGVAYVDSRLAAVRQRRRRCRSGWPVVPPGAPARSAHRSVRTGPVGAGVESGRGQVQLVAGRPGPRGAGRPICARSKAMVDPSGSCSSSPLESADPATISSNSAVMAPMRASREAPVRPPGRSGSVAVGGSARRPAGPSLT